jgi:RNA polymerase sigma-70 factor (ECF subfamily)
MTPSLRDRPDTGAVTSQLHSRLHAFIARRAESREVAEDLTQEVFVRLARREDGDLADPTAWLYRVARNTIIDHYRSRRPTLPLDDAQTAGREPEVDPFAENPAQARAEIAVCLRGLLDQLNEPYRSAVAAVDFHDQTHASVAAATGLSVPGVKSRVQRGRRQLRQLLTDCCTTHTGADGRLIDLDTSPGCDPGAGCTPSRRRDLT